MTKLSISIFTLFAALILAVGAGATEASAQGNRATPMLTTPPDPCKVAPEVSSPPHFPEGYVAPTEQEQRYSYLFAILRGWEGVAKEAQDKGETGWAEHFRTMLERESGLSASEAAQVKQIAFQYLNDDETLLARDNAAAAEQRPARANEVYIEAPEKFIARRKKHSDLLDKAIADLVTALGSRAFSRLDFYTLHMNDQMKENAARAQAECAKNGAR